MNPAHPYRSSGATATARDGFEQRSVAIVLMIAGGIGVGIGLVAPRANATELVLGFLLLLLGTRTL